MNLPDEVLDHLLGNFEVGDHTVPHGSDRLDRAGRAAQHALGLVAHGEHPPLAPCLSQRHHRRLVQHDALPTHVHQRVGCAEVYGHVGRKQAQKA